jgi:hypothetical protein
MSQESEASGSPTTISLPNTKSGSPTDISTEIEAVVAPRDEGPSSTTSAVLESQLSGERAERRVERFFFLFVIAIMFDAILYKYLDNGWAFTVLTVMILILLIGVANWLEVPWVVRHLEACLAWMSGRKPNNETE